MRRPNPLLAVFAVLPLLACSKKSEGTASDAPATSSAAAPSAAAPGAPPATGSGATLAGGFEGAITMTTSHEGRPPEAMTFLVKGDRLRIEAPGGHGMEMHAIFDPASKKMTMLLDGPKAYVDMDLGEMMAKRAATPGGAPPEITKTGKHETVAGYDCEVWKIKESNGKEADACVTQGITFIDIGAGMGGSPQAKAWMDEWREKKLFPLRVVEHDASGKEGERMEVTKIEKKPLDEALFTVPAGYKKMGGPGGMMPGMPGMSGLGGAPHAPRPSH